MDQLTPLQAIVYDLARRYVERQRLCRLVLQEIRPDLISDDGPPLPRASREYAHRTQIGTWGDGGEWNYHIHGGGCRLINKQTQEPLDWWDPNITRFDAQSLAYWVAWLAQTNGDESAARTLQEFAGEFFQGDLRLCLLSILGELSTTSLVGYYPVDTNRYELQGRVD